MHVIALLLALTGCPLSGSDDSPWQLPLGDLTSVVGRFDPDAGRFGAGHRGVDLAGHDGDEVRAAGAGTVSFASLLAGRGVLVITHGALRTTYEPVEAEVLPGERVEAGQVVGRLRSGHLRCLPGACLHWGLRRGEVHLDPLTLVGARRVRLLPLDGSARPAALGPSPDLAAAPPEPGSALTPSPEGAAAGSADPSGSPPGLLALGVVASGAAVGWAYRRWAPG